VTEGFRERGVTFRNNDLARIAAIDEKKVTLDDGRAMAKDFLHLDQGVCITSYASQCRTVRQIVALAPIQSFAQMDAKTFYVLASRATHQAIFFTDCKDALKEAVIRPGDRQTVWDFEKDFEFAPAALQKVIDLHPGKRVKSIARAAEPAAASKPQQCHPELEMER
jgi:hypothetical protein